MSNEFLDIPPAMPPEEPTMASPSVAMMSGAGSTSPEMAAMYEEEMSPVAAEEIAMYEEEMGGGMGGAEMPYDAAMGGGSSSMGSPFASEEEAMIAAEERAMAGGGATGGGGGGSPSPQGVKAMLQEEEMQSKEASQISSVAEQNFQSSMQQAQSFDATLNEG